MRLDDFVAEREPVWAELDASVRRARTRPERLGADGVLALGAAYRAAAADLALVRREWPGDPIQRRLEDLVGRAHHLVYDRAARRDSVVAFFKTTYWRRIAERSVFLGVSAALLFVPMVLAAVWGVVDPVAAEGVVPAPFRSAADASGGDLGIPVVQQAASASTIFVNNIRVTFLAFAGGIAVGFGTAAIEVYNGLFIGAVAGLAIEGGAAKPLAELVAPHGVLELSCITVAGGAGLRMGWALVDPGPLRRTESLRREARRGAEVVLGTMPWLVAAGLVEGFVTPAGFGLPAALAVGFSLGGAYWLLVWSRGRALAPVTAAPATSP